MKAITLSAIVVLLLVTLHTIGGAPSCADKSPFCKRYSPSSYCTNRYKHYWTIMKFCPKHCSICTDTCGRSQSLTSRVIGGSDAKPGQWPWNVAIWRNNNFICGGVLINSEFVLTSAACLINANPYNIRVSIGETDIVRRDGEQFIRVHKIIRHSRYVGGKNLQDDIALLELAFHARYNSMVQPICLPDFKSSAAPGTVCYLTGWGKLQAIGGKYKNAHPKLQQAPLKIKANDKCHQKNYKGHPITDGMICGEATATSGHQGACLGDFGSPLVCQSSDGSWQLHGIVSWIQRLCNTDIFDTVFTRIAAYRQWIDKNVPSV